MKKYIYLLTISSIVLCGCHKDINKESHKSLAPQTTDSNLFAAEDNAVPLPDDLNKRVISLLNIMPTENGLGFGKWENTLTQQQATEIQNQSRSESSEKGNIDDKYLSIFHWINSNITHGNSENDPYNTFINHKAVCEGFAGLLRIMLTDQQVPTVIANGFTKQRAGYRVNLVAHAWNYVKLHDEWKAADPTWNEQDAVNTDGRNDGFKKITPISDNRLIPLTIDSPIYEDEYAVYKYKNGFFNVDKVKKANSDKAFIVPFSIKGIVVDCFDPSSPLPQDIETLYISSNIKSLGENGVGLVMNRSNLKYIKIKSNNKYLQSYKNTVYKILEREDNFQTFKKYKKLYKTYYIPEQLDTIYLAPNKGTLMKGTVTNHPNVTDLYVAKDTKYIDRYAIENCPKLVRIHVPKPIGINRDAIALKQKYEIIYYDIF